MGTAAGSAGKPEAFAMLTWEGGKGTIGREVPGGRSFHYSLAGWLAHAAQRRHTCLNFPSLLPSLVTPQSRHGR